MLKSDATEQEFRRTLEKPQLGRLLRDFAFVAHLRTLVVAAERIPVDVTLRACRDSDDDKFLELAIAGHADLIVSGDADLLALDPFRGIAIVDPATFVRPRLGQPPVGLSQKPATFGA